MLGAIIFDDFRKLDSFCPYNTVVGFPQLPYSETVNNRPGGGLITSPGVVLVVLVLVFVVLGVVLVVIDVVASHYGY